MEGTAISIIGGLLLRLVFPEPLVLLKSGEPSFLHHIPPQYYVGISIESAQLATAKEDAIQDAVMQIFHKVGLVYRVSFSKSVRKTDYVIGHVIEDVIHYEGGGYLADVEVKQLHAAKDEGKYTVYALVFFPEHKIVQVRQHIRKENGKRMAQFKSFIDSGKNLQESGELDAALQEFEFALGLVDVLFIGRRSSRLLAESHINKTKDAIMERERILKELRSRKPKLRVSALEVTDQYFAFEVAEVNGVDIVFDRYDVSVNAQYRNAGFISYYIKKVDKTRNASRSFDLIRPISVRGNSTKVVMIPVNHWVREKESEFSSVMLGSDVEYSLQLHYGGLSVGVR